jgi:ubiquinone/menaquinone biosynthesis C-methylase UbiE
MTRARISEALERIADATARPGVTTEVGDARALPAADGSVDAVLIRGPPYHLTVALRPA